MEEDELINAVKQARQNSPERNFNQSFDLVITLKNVDLTTPEKKIEIFEQLPNGRGKKEARVAAFVGKALVKEAKKHCDEVIQKKEFSDWAEDPRKVRKLVRRNDYFIAEGSLMMDVAKNFGKYLGSKKKMPNPKGGQVITPKTDIEDLIRKLKRTVVLRVKKQPMIQALVGTEDMSDESVAENIKTVISEVKRFYAPYELDQALLKLTMGRPVELW